MTTIIYEHAIFLMDAQWQNQHQDIIRLLILPAKFGTISFFTISGFLLGDKLAEQKPGHYLKRRFDNTFKPYLIALSAYVLITGFKFFEVGKGDHFDIAYFPYQLYAQFLRILFNSAYWFIWVYFISLSVILIFRRYLNTQAFPVIALAVSVFYGINVYLGLVPVKHTTAIFAYVFYLWFGMFLNKNQEYVFKTLSRISVKLIIAAAFIILMADLYESTWSTDPDVTLNTIRITNQLYSVVMFFLLLKLSKYNLPSFFIPRYETYGIYLYHMFFITLFSQLLYHTRLNSMLRAADLAIFISVYMLIFFIVYMGTTVFVKALNHTSLCWLTGMGSRSLIQ